MIYKHFFLTYISVFDKMKIESIYLNIFYESSIFRFDCR
nr:MAG TPA: hypothetical protein [Caudoviricetes sp.]